MKIKQSKPAWFIAIFLIIAIALALSYKNKQHIDYATGRIRSSQSIAGFMYNPTYEDTWITPYVSTSYKSNWISIHYIYPFLSAARRSEGSRALVYIETTNNILETITVEEKSKKLIATTILDSLNQTGINIDPYLATVDSLQCFQSKLPTPPPLNRTVTSEEISALIEECFNTTLPE